MDSPFDYRRSALLYTVEDMPEPNRPGYQKGLQDVIIGLCEATRGRALVLFTSYSALTATYRAVKPILEAAGIVVLGQRLDGGPRQLIERFKQHQEMVLFGTSSFWEGVDVVGDALSVLVITKLPFKVPSDPGLPGALGGIRGPVRGVRRAAGGLAVPPGLRAADPLQHGPRRLRRARFAHHHEAVRPHVPRLPARLHRRARPRRGLPARASAWLAMAGPERNVANREDGTAETQRTRRAQEKRTNSDFSLHILCVLCVSALYRFLSASWQFKFS